MTNLKFQKLVTITNQVAADFNGTRDTCVLTSFALHDVLRRLGYNSRPLRIEAAVFPDDRKFIGTILGGWREPGSRQPASSPGMWKGHLAVTVEDQWLLDPTLDQANKKEWPREIHVGPLAVPLTKKFWAGSILVRTSGCTVRFSAHPRQTGFKNAGDARPSHWRPLADQILQAVGQANNAGHMIPMPPWWIWFAAVALAWAVIFIGPSRGQTTADDWFRLVTELDRQFDKIGNEPDRRFVARMINELSVSQGAMPTPAEAKWLLSIKADLERQGRRR